MDGKIGVRSLTTQGEDIESEHKINAACNSLSTCPPDFPTRAQRTPDEFAQDARLAMAVKLYEMGRLSSGLAAQIAQMPRVAFLLELARYGVPVISLSPHELATDFANA